MQTGVLIDNRADDEILKDFKHEEFAMGSSDFKIPVKTPKQRYFYPYNQHTSLSCVSGGGSITLEFYDGKIISRKDIYNRRVNYPSGGMMGVDLLKIMAKGACEDYLMPSQAQGESKMNERPMVTTDILASRANNKTGVYFTFEKPTFDKVAEQCLKTPVVAFFYFHENGREWWKEVPNVMVDFNSPVDEFTTRHQATVVDCCNIGGVDYLIVQDTAGVGTGFGEDYNLRYITREFASKRLYWAGYAIDDLEEVNMPVKPVFAQSKAMRVGDRGENVRQLQEVLIYEGLLKIPKATNYFGGMTRRAVIDLQNKYRAEILTPVGLKSGTGYIGKSSLAFLNKKYANTI